jgi:hypothetical protein
MHIERYRSSRYWAVYGCDGTLICLTVYKKGAQEVVRRLQDLDGTPNGQAPPGPSPLLQITPRTRRRWRRALAIAAILMEEEGYHTASLTAISQALTQE